MPLLAKAWLVTSLWVTSKPSMRCCSMHSRPVTSRKSALLNAAKSWASRPYRTSQQTSSKKTAIRSGSALRSTKMMSTMHARPLHRWRQRSLNCMRLWALNPQNLMKRAARIPQLPKKKATMQAALVSTSCTQDFLPSLVSLPTSCSTEIEAKLSLDISDIYSSYTNSKATLFKAPSDLSKHTHSIAESLFKHEDLNY